jgi:hypothetical protein
MTLHRPEERTPIEEALRALYTAEPAPDFVAGLEALLWEEAQKETTSARPLSTSYGGRGWWSELLAYLGRRRRWAVATLAVVFLLGAALVIIGPGQVLAAIQRWAGYVPGVGFVDLNQTRLLVEPVSQTQDGVTLQVVQLSAGVKSTVLVLESRGLPENGVETEALPMPQLRLPDGTEIVATESRLDYGRGRYFFPPLPASITRATLLLPRLPLVPPGAGPEEWEVPLLLQPAGGSLETGLIRAAYQPVNAAATHGGVTLRVLEVAHDATGTALRTEVVWTDPGWRHYSLDGGRRLPFLQDDRGHVYPQTYDQAGSVAVVRAVEEPGPSDTSRSTSYQETSTYEPVQAAARELMLVVDALDFEVPVDLFFTVDLGHDPQIGDVFPLDVTLDAAGVPVRLTGARLVRMEQPISPTETKTEVHLAFDVPPVPEEDGRLLFGLHFEAAGAGFTGSSGGYTPATNQLRAALVLREGASLPAGVIEVRLTGVSIWLHGPWAITWPVPEGEPGE